MPVMDGIEALSLIREKDKNVKILMVTAAGQKGKVVDAVKNGATEFITKPFENDKILNAVNKCLND
jgi:two-component system chemotaxis response regulator CheY